MKILAISDQVEPRFLRAGQSAPVVQKIDIILSCGDLPASYLEYLVTLLNVPLCFVLGNHDEQLLGKHLDGCTCIDETTVIRKGRIIGGLSGSTDYNDGQLMFSEVEMLRKISRLYPRLLWNKLRYGRHLDIFISHSPISGILDETTHAHRGFKVLRMFDKCFKPRLHLHGHTMVKGRKYVARYHSTEIININHFRIFDV